MASGEAAAPQRSDRLAAQHSRYNYAVILGFMLYTVWTNFGAASVKADTGKPQGRGRIERFFRTVNEMFLCDLDGYIRHKKRAPSMSLDQFNERFRYFLLEISSAAAALRASRLSATSM